MAKKPLALGDIEEPKNREEFAENLFDIVVETGIKNPELLNRIPCDSQTHEYKSSILNMYSSTKKFGMWYDIDICEMKNKKDNYDLIEGSPFAKMGKEWGIFIREVVVEETIENIQQHRDYIENKLKVWFPILQSPVKWTHICGYDKNDEPIKAKMECKNVAAFIDYTPKYVSDLKNGEERFWKSVAIHTADGKQRVKDIKNEAAKKAFISERQTDKLKFAESLFALTDICRFKKDVALIANRYITMGRYIDGETVRSNIMCWFNSDSIQGQNGKTYRMNLEKEYMQSKGFITSDAPLQMKGISDINVLANHFYYLDEYDFSGVNTEFLKKINKNIRPTLSGRVMFQGNRQITNEAMFILACHNGVLANNLLAQGRCMDGIRISDAKYEDNKDNMVFIYKDKNDCPEHLLTYNPVATTIGEYYKDIKVISYEDLFDGLLKYSKGITIPQSYLKPSNSTGLIIKQELLQIIEDLCTILNSATDFSAADLIHKLAREKYFNDEDAKNEVKKLIVFIKDNYPKFIVHDDKNWDRRKLRITPEFKQTITQVVADSIIETDYSLLDKQELWLYILEMLGLDPSAPIPDKNEQDKEYVETYDELCELFISTNEHKMHTEIPMYEGVNIPNNTPSEGHTSLFSNDNLFLMHRFLVEYDPPKDTPQEEIESIKKQTIEFAKSLPTFRVVDSGNKSIHIMFCFDSKTYPDNVQEYKFAVDFVRKQLGLPDSIGVAALDTKVLYDPSRITRKPGVMRDNGKEQALISFNKEKLHIEWKSAYKEYIKKTEEEKIMHKTLYSNRTNFVSSATDIDTFIDNYYSKKCLPWTDGHRHDVAAQLAGACAKAGFGEQESIEAIERRFDCSSDKTITSNLHKFF